MMLLIDDGRGGARGVEPSRTDRVRARVSARTIDRRLANGASPDSDVIVALHARRLTGMRERRRLADGLTHALAISTQPQRSAATLVHRHAVAAAEAEVLDLCGQLLRSGPVSVRGVACVRALLTSGTGPMYDVLPRGSLGAALRHAAELLDVDVSAS